MAKKVKKKYYAVHWIDEKKDMIFTSWADCQKAIKGHNNMFKSFPVEEQAKEWLNGITKGMEKNHNELVAKQRELKKIKKSKVVYRFRLEKDLSDKFQEKLKVMRTDADTVIADFVKEYVWEE